MSKNKLTCEIIQDLLPSYVDGLTSEVTNGAVEEHLKGCESCTKTMERMQETDHVGDDGVQKQEIDFLKKTRRKNRYAIIASVLLAVAVIAGGLFIRYYWIGTAIEPETVACKVSVSGNTVAITGTVTDSAIGVSGTDFEEEDGIVTISFKGTLASVFHTGTFESEYTAAKPITQVRLGDRIIWANGEKISPLTSAVYRAKHPYIGDASANTGSMFALGMFNGLGELDSELQTTKEPYGWKLNLCDEILSKEESKMQERMKSYAYVLLATIDNLEYVTYDYLVRGESAGITITREDASGFAGQDIKTCGDTPARLQKLMEKAGLIQYGFASEQDYEDYIYNPYLHINIVQNTDAQIREMNMQCYVDGEETVEMGSSYADGSCIKKNDVMDFGVYAQDLGKNYIGISEVQFKLEIVDVEGTVYQVDTPIHIIPKERATYYYILTGNAKDGFELYQ